MQDEIMITLLGSAVLVTLGISIMKNRDKSPKIVGDVDNGPNNGINAGSRSNKNINIEAPNTNINVGEYVSNIDINDIFGYKVFKRDESSDEIISPESLSQTLSHASHKYIQCEENICDEKFDHNIISEQIEPISSFILKNEYNNNKIYKNEEEVRNIFESLFYPRKFKTVRLKALTNPYTGYRLEIDGLCEIKTELESIFVGFEYQGEQHYRRVDKFHRSDRDFEKQQMRDEWKRIKCKRLGYKIIYVPYNVSNKRTYIINKLKRYPDLFQYYSRNLYRDELIQ